MVGSVVYSKAGRDKGKFMVIVGFSGGMPVVADGKERPLSRPKLKNPKHLKETKVVLSEQQYSTDKSLRRALSEFSLRQPAKQEED